MKKFILTFFISTAAIVSASGQLCYPEEIVYPGKASFSIDGYTTDWQSLLGNYSGDPQNPYFRFGILNYSYDATAPFNEVGCVVSDLDNPQPQNDLRFSAFVTDDYNFYFYLRRPVDTGGTQTVYYFLDINADGFMKSGEPVISIQFNAQKVIKYKLGKFIENASTDFMPGKGNYSYKPNTAYTVDGYSIKGNVAELFDSRHLPDNITLSGNDIFDAAITDQGYGLELSVPRKYLINWDQQNELPLAVTDMITYHISNQKGAGPYNYNKVEDNMGSCCQSLGIIGIPTASVVSHNTVALIPGQKYQIQVSLRNETNIAATIRLPQLITSYQGAQVTMVKDYNNNGIADMGEPSSTYTEIYIGTYMPFASSSNIVTQPGELASYILTIQLASPVNQFQYSLQPTIETWNRHACNPTACGYSEGGRPINPIGFTETIEDVTMRKPIEQIELVPGLLKIFPNPGNGNLTIVLPLSSEDYQVSLSDNLGKRMKVYDRVKASLQINGLQNGVYFLQITNKKTRFTETRKIIVQK